MARSSSVWIVGSWVALTLAAVTASSAGNDSQPPAQESKAAATPKPRAAEAERSPFMQAVAGEQGAAPAKVYSNTDLEQMFGGAPSAKKQEAPPAQGATPASEPSERVEPESETEAETARVPVPAEQKGAVDALLEREAARAEYAQSIADAELQVRQAQKRVSDLEQRQLAARNPLLPRPAAPEEGAEEWQAMNGAQRAARADEELRSAREALTEAEQELARLRASRP